MDAKGARACNVSNLRIVGITVTPNTRLAGHFISTPAPFLCRL